MIDTLLVRSSSIMFNILVVLSIQSRLSADLFCTADHVDCSSVCVCDNKRCNIKYEYNQ